MKSCRLLIIGILPLLSLFHLAMPLPAGGGNPKICSKCICGAVSLQLSDTPSETAAAVDCHCPKCRKYHVAAFASYLLVDKEHVALEGETLKSFEDACSEAGAVRRLFCGKCYAKVATRRTSDGSYLINLGGLQDAAIPGPLSAKLRTHRRAWQLNSKAVWKDSKPRFTGGGKLIMPRLEIRGSCACGVCAYACAPPGELQHCYCTLCRRLSGGPFQTWIPAGELVWTGTEPQLVRTTNHGRRHVCRDCGGVLTIVYDENPGFVWPAAGGLDDESLPENLDEYLRRVIHICCVWKQAWYELPNDGLERIQYAC